VMLVLGLGLATQILGLGLDLEPQVLVNITANWSSVMSDGMAGFNHLLTTICSAMCDKIGVTEICRKSPSKNVGVATFDTGVCHLPVSVNLPTGK